MVTHRYPLPEAGMPVLPVVKAYKLVLSAVWLNEEYVPGVAPLGTVCRYAPAGTTNGPPWHVTLTGYWLRR